MLRLALRCFITAAIVALFIWLTWGLGYGGAFLITLMAFCIIWVVTGVILQPRTWWRS